MNAVLFVTPRFPYPALKGDQTVCYHRLRHLARDHRITLLSCYENEADLAGLDEVKRHCVAVHTVHLPRWRSLAQVALAAAQPQVPLQVAYYRSAAFTARLRALAASGEFDLVHGFLLRLAPHLAGLGLPVLLELIDSMQLNLERRLGHERGPSRWALGEELRRIAAYERQIGRVADALTVVSRLDADRLGPGEVHTVPNGVDTDAFAPAPAPCAEPVVVFSGNMGYAPNIQAVQWFVAHCLPRLRARRPDIRFVIAGADPAPEVVALGTAPGVTVTGRVASMPAVLASARLAVAPMQSGSGMQNKILEAMACALPVVTTPLGRGDIQAEAGRAIAVADTPEAFADTVLALLEAPAAAEAMGRAARAYVLGHHSWAHAADRIRALYAAIGAARRSHGAA